MCFVFVLVFVRIPAGDLVMLLLRVIAGKTETFSQLTVRRRLSFACFIN